MGVDEALSEISALRLQMARSTEFRGFGPGALAATGLVAVAAAAGQGVLAPDPIADIHVYLGLWSGAAILSVGVVAAEAIRRSRVAHQGLADDMLVAAAEQFLPSAFAGVLLTFVLLARAPDALWMLPGLWQVILGVGVFAACRNLPPGLNSSRAGTWRPASRTSPSRKEPSRSRLGRWGCLSPSARGWRRRCCGAAIGADTNMSDAPKFAYEGLDRVLHERARLGILTSLVAHPKGVVFGELKHLCGLTDGNLSRHLAVLGEEGIVELVKSFPNNRPQTLCRITASGRRRYLEYLRVLEKVVRDAGEAMKSADVLSARGRPARA